MTEDKKERMLSAVNNSVVELAKDIVDMSDTCDHKTRENVSKEYDDQVTYTLKVKNGDGESVVSITNVRSSFFISVIWFDDKDEDRNGYSDCKSVQSNCIMKNNRLYDKVNGIFEKMKAKHKATELEDVLLSKVSSVLWIPLNISEAKLPNKDYEKRIKKRQDAKLPKSFGSRIGQEDC